jgi:hypothetical protein
MSLVEDNSLEKALEPEATRLVFGEALEAKLHQIYHLTLYNTSEPRFLGPTILSAHWGLEVTAIDETAWRRLK